MTTTVDSTDYSGAGVGAETTRKVGPEEPVSLAVVKPEPANAISSIPTLGGCIDLVEGDGDILDEDLY